MAIQESQIGINAGYELIDVRTPLLQIRRIMHVTDPSTGRKYFQLSKKQFADHFSDCATASMIITPINITISAIYKTLKTATLAHFWQPYREGESYQLTRRIKELVTDVSRLALAPVLFPVAPLVLEGLALYGLYKKNVESAKNFEKTERLLLGAPYLSVPFLHNEKLSYGPFQYTSGIQTPLTFV